MKNAEALTRDVSPKHPAIRSWSELSGCPPGPARVQLLKNEHDRKVWRLIGVGPGGSNVIAKLNPKADVAAEHRIYREALKRLPLPAPDHFGLLKDKNDSLCWAFLEDMRGIPYSRDEKVHWRVTAEFLAVLHTSGFEILRDVQLRQRGPSYYQHCLQAGRRQVRSALDYGHLTQAQRNVLTGIVEQCDATERRWRRLEQFCGSIPQTFVHGDLGKGNVCLRPGLPEPRIVLLDWVSAGWGFCGIDLTPANLDLEAYSLIVRKVWPALDVKTCREMAAIGQLFRSLWAIQLESVYLESEGDRLYWTIDALSYYRADMAVALRESSVL
jgi:hypothetical protein